MLRRLRHDSTLLGGALALSMALSAQAAPIVAGFDRFATESGTGVDPGQMLYNELHCAACHGEVSPMQAAFPERQAPILDAVGARVRLQYLRDFIAHPQDVKPGTAMPDMMAGWDDGERAEASEALAHFLASQGGPMAPESPGAEVELRKRGGDLYHTVGCVACHAPQHDAGAANAEDGFWDDNVETPPIALPSVPLPNFFGKTSPEALTAFLLDPAKVRPGGRMPDMSLEEGEAAAIAHWLIAGDDPEGMPPAADPPIEPAKVARGQELFRQLGCASCHQLGDAPAALPAPPLAGKSLAARGCLSESPAAGTPWFGLSEAQRAALLALAPAPEDAAPDNRQIINHTLLALNCYACHERGGLGGPEPGRAVYFTETDHQDLGDEGRMPPTLTAVGGKLTPDWLEAILTEGGRVRPYMATRMPHFGEEHVMPLAAALLAEDANPDPVPVNVTGLEHHHRNHYGRELMGTGGLGCVTCHDLDGHRSLGIPAVDLAVVPARLQPEWFKRYMLDPASLRPGTRMPAFFIDGKSQGSKLFNGDAGKQIEALWVYLREVKETRLPEGMEDTGNFELKPAGHPLVHRTFMKEAGPRAIAVGFPEGIHYAFDGDDIRPALLWRGRFIDAESAQADRFTPIVTPLGEDVASFPAGPAVAADPTGPWSAGALRFGGYRLDKTRTPIFQYRIGEVRVQDALRPTGDGEAFRRKLQFKGPPQTLYLRLGQGEATGEGSYRIGGLRIAITTGPDAIAGPEDVGWLLPVEITEAGTAIEQVISW